MGIGGSTAARIALLVDEWMDEHADEVRREVSEGYSTSSCLFLQWAESVYRARLDEQRAQVEQDPNDYVELASGWPVPVPAAGGYWLYRLFNDEQRLIYVGVTVNPKSRLRSHVRTFGGMLARVEWERCDSKEDMLSREALAISDECPAFNHAHPKAT